MFERFTNRARRVVVLAQEEARMRGHNSIDTEHLLLGLICEGEGMAARVLTSLGVQLDTVREQVTEIIGQGDSTPGGHIPFTPRTKKALELSLREALQLGHHSIGTEHILLGLIREGEGVAAGLLQKLGADLDRVRQQVIQLLRTYSGEPAPSPARSLEELDDFTDALLDALVAARAEAHRVGMSTVEVGPLLVGLLSIEDGSCARILGSELSIERLRAVIGQEVEQTTPRAASPLPLSASARTALRSHYPGAGGLVGTGHIARALVGEDAIAALLEAADADVGKVREAARRLDGDGGLP